MVELLLSLRFLMLLAWLGSACGGVLMFLVGGGKLIKAVSLFFTADTTADATPVITAVMGATDAFLFGIVLMIFAYTVAFGFVFAPSRALQERMPSWMHIQSIRALKHTLVEVVLVYLVVDFATDLEALDVHLPWEILIKPIAILLIAGSLRLLGTDRDADAPTDEVQKE
jgi:uncharacterized membrane protein YqhA